MSTTQKSLLVVDKPMEPATDYRPPKETVGDHAHVAIRAGIQLIPLVGGAVNELFQAIFHPPLRERQAEWMEAVSEGLMKLAEQQRCVLDALTEKPVFVDTIVQASQAAVRTAERDKREALRNAVLNSALSHEPDGSLQQVFVGLVDTFTIWHLRILDLVDAPAEWFQRNSRTVPSLSDAKLEVLIRAAFPELKARGDFCELISHDLHARGLTRIASFREMIQQYSPPAMGRVGPSHGSMPGIEFVSYSEVALMQRWTTNLGRQFLTFIKSPID